MSENRTGAHAHPGGRLTQEFVAVDPERISGVDPDHPALRDSGRHGPVTEQGRARARSSRELRPRGSATRAVAAVLLASLASGGCGAAGRGGSADTACQVLPDATVAETVGQSLTRTTGFYGVDQRACEYTTEDGDATVVVGVLRFGSAGECARQAEGFAALEFTGRFLSWSMRDEGDAPEMSCEGTNLAYAWITGAPGAQQAKDLHAAAVQYAQEWGALGAGPAAGRLALSGGGWTGSTPVEAACYREGGVDVIELGAVADGTVLKIIISPVTPDGPRMLVMTHGTFNSQAWSINEDDPGYEGAVLFDSQAVRLDGVAVPPMNSDDGSAVTLTGIFNCP